MDCYGIDDTIFAPATVPGTGAITIVRVSGPQALIITDSIVSCPGLSGGIVTAVGNTIHFGSVRLSGGELLDEVLVSVFRAPHSYTGEDSAEISCHASPYILSELSALLLSAGARPAQPGEFTKRAFLNGKMDLAQAEAVADVIASQSAAAHRIAMSQMKGGYSAELKSMRDEMLQIASLMELELDFSEEDVEFADRSRLDGLLSAAVSHVEGLAGSFRLGNAVKNGVPTAIIGAANTGKSTLLNKLLGEERAIVSPIRGTTRDTIEEAVNIDGVMFRFIDTAGLRDTSEEVEKIGIERTLKKAAEAEIVLGMVDGTAPEPERTAQVEGILSLTDPSRQDVRILVNKCDLLAPSHDPAPPPINENLETKHTEPHLPRIVEISESAAGGISEQFPEMHRGGLPGNEGKEHKIKFYFISAKTGEGVPALLHDLASAQKERISNAGTVAVTNYRHLEALRTAGSALKRVRSGLGEGIPTDLLVQDLREALDAVGSITGQILPDEVLGTVFNSFCIGK